MDNKSRAPLIKVIDNKYLIVATRDAFKLFLYNYAVKETDLKRKSKFSKAKEKAPHHRKELLHNFLISSEDIDFPVKDPGFHCLEHMVTKEGRRYLVFGGNHNVSILSTTLLTLPRKFSNLSYKAKEELSMKLCTREQSISGKATQICLDKK